MRRLFFSLLMFLLLFSSLPPARGDACGPGALRPVEANEGGKAVKNGIGFDTDKPGVRSAREAHGIGETRVDAHDIVTWTYQTTDGPAQSRCVELDLFIDNAPYAKYFFWLDVRNVPPQASFFLTSNTIEVNGTVTASLNGAYDPSIDDTNAGFTYFFDCGMGGAPVETKTNAADCGPYRLSATYIVSGVVCDKDGAAKPINWSGTGNANEGCSPVQAQKLQVMLPTVVGGGITITKTVNWNDSPPDPHQRFEICVTGAPTPCQTVGSEGGVLRWSGLPAGTYQISETDPGSEWTVTSRDEPITNWSVVLNPREQLNLEITNTHRHPCTDLIGQPPQTRNWQPGDTDVITNISDTAIRYDYEIQIVSDHHRVYKKDSQVLQKGDSLTFEYPQEGNWGEPEDNQAYEVHTTVNLRSANGFTCGFNWDRFYR
jgi:hypothetical protein